MSLRQPPPRNTALSDILPAAVEARPPPHGAEHDPADPVSEAVNLRECRRRSLSRAERIRIVEQGLRILEETYAHLRMKQTMHAIDPVGRLKLLLRALREREDHDPLEEDEFQREMLDIFFSLRDRHTVYTLPAYWDYSVAFLPFMVEEIGRPQERKYIVSKVLGPFETATFRPGAEVVYWNGVPIEQAIWNYAQRHAGSNLDARRAMGLLNLTLRALQYDPAPDEHWVAVEYRPPRGNGRLLASRFDWKVGEDPWPRMKRDSGGDASDPRLETAQNMRLAMYGPKAGARSRAAPKARAIRGVTFTEVRTSSWRVFRARRYQTPDGPVGYVRIWRFSELGERQFRDEFISILKKLPQSGLVIDVRGNPGGKINLAEVILQTLTPVCIQPETFQFRNTQVASHICEAAPESEGLLRWKASIEEGLRTGATYSAAFPKSDVGRCNEERQYYFGAVVLVTDALTYSAGDLFAAGFQDHGIGWVLGVHEATGAGGANRWSYDKLLALDLPGEPFRALPQDAGFNVAIRRSLRVHERNGSVLEDFGVRPDERHYMTRDDILNDNVDLIRKAASLLRRPVPEVDLEIRPVMRGHQGRRRRRVSTR